MKKEATIIDCPFAVWTGLEPATPCVTGMYSNQLNYHTNAYCPTSDVCACLTMTKVGILFEFARVAGVFFIRFFLCG